MAGVRVPDTRALPPGHRRELVLAVHRLYELAGKPAMRRVSMLIRERDDLPGTLSHEGVSSVLRGAGSTHRWANLESLVRVLAEMSISKLDVELEVVRVHRLWLAADAGEHSISSAIGESDINAAAKESMTNRLRQRREARPEDPASHESTGSSPTNAEDASSAADDYVRALRADLGERKSDGDEPLIRWNSRLRTLDVFDRQMAVKVIESVGSLDE